MEAAKTTIKSSGGRSVDNVYGCHQCTQLFDAHTLVSFVEM